MMHYIALFASLILILGFVLWVLGWLGNVIPDPEWTWKIRTPFKVVLWTIIVPIFALGGYYYIVDLAK